MEDTKGWEGLHRFKELIKLQVYGCAFYAWSYKETVLLSTFFRWKEIEVTKSSHLPDIIRSINDGDDI